MWKDRTEFVCVCVHSCMVMGCQSIAKCLRSQFVSCKVYQFSLSLPVSDQS